MNYTTTSGTPVAFVTKGKQRLKQFENTVYLNNGDEFEIELFNPTQNKVLAKIELDGKSIGSGIVLRPGERVFLERYLDVARKFLFETYKVTGSNEQVKRAIANNGGVSVKFYQEYIRPVTTFSGTPYTLWGGNGNYFGNSGTYSGGYVGQTTTNMPFGSTVINTNSTAAGFNSSIGTSATTSNFFNSTLTSSNSGTDILRTSGLGEVTTDSISFMSQELDRKTPKIKTLKARSMSKEVETGRVEKGSNSNQNFTYDSTSFLSYASWTSEWKILPTSQKIKVKEDLQVFCTQCGTKRKKDSHKFCPTCGTKY